MLIEPVILLLCAVFGIAQVQRAIPALGPVLAMDLSGELPTCAEQATWPPLSRSRESVRSTTTPTRNGPPAFAFPTARPPPARRPLRARHSPCRRAPPPG